MNSMMDMMIATVVMGLLILAAMNVDSNTRSSVITSRQDLSAQQIINVLSDIVEEDFRKIGHGLNKPLESIILADSSHIIFSYDRDPSSNYDSTRVEYYLVPALSTPNPFDKKLIRNIKNGQDSGTALGITRFKLQYYNKNEVKLQSPVVSDSLSKIRRIELDLVVHSTESFRDRYATARYVTQFVPKNLLVEYGQ